MFRSLVWQWADRQNGAISLIRLKITILHGVVISHGPVPYSSSRSCDLFHQRSPAVPALRGDGYDAFSVSESNVESVRAYILNQAEHHKKFSYQEEIREIFKRHRVAFDERYVWD